jgi:hypothetical protein
MTVLSVCSLALSQGVQYPAYLGIGKVDGSQIGLNRFAPLVVCDYVCMIPIWRHCKVPLARRAVDFPRQSLPIGAETHAHGIEIVSLEGQRLLTRGYIPQLRRSIRTR